MLFQYNDGGRLAAGFKGECRDCVVRSLSIVAGKPYGEVYDELSKGVHESKIKQRIPRGGVKTSSKWFKIYMQRHGWVWVPTMQIGQGCKVHLVDGELPSGDLIVSVSKHYTAVVNGVIQDTHDPSRNGKRCVYGYWIKQ